jgi:hypothetical protein
MTWLVILGFAVVLADILYLHIMRQRDQRRADHRRYDRFMGRE